MIPSSQRMGHGLLLAKYEMAINFAKKAFEEASSFVANGVQHTPVCAAQVADTRAVYTTTVDKWAGALCTAVSEASSWEYVRLHYGMPSLDGIQVMKTIIPSNDTERFVIVIHVSPEWETKLDSLEKNSKREVVLKIGYANIALRKRRDGAQPVTRGEPSKDPPAAAAAAAAPSRSSTSRSATPTPQPSGATATGLAKQGMDFT